MRPQLITLRQALLHCLRKFEARSRRPYKDGAPPTLLLRRGDAQQLLRVFEANIHVAAPEQPGNRAEWNGSRRTFGGKGASFVLSTALVGPVQALLTADAPATFVEGIRAQLILLADSYLQRISANSDRALAGHSVERLVP